MMMSHRVTKFVAAGAAVVVLAASGLSLANSSSGNGTSGATNTTQTVAPSRGAAPPQGAAPSQSAQSGQLPPNWRPGTGTPITGAAANKAKAVALTKYKGTVNRVLKLSDGSYAVHMIGTSGPHHVFVSKAFKITGAA
jgi:hypothetical protein